MRERARAWFWRHRALIGYLFLVALAMLALEWHHSNRDDDIRRNDIRIEQNARALCRAAREVTANQRFIMETQRVILVYLHQQDGAALAILRRESDLVRRLATLPTYSCKEEP